MKNRLLIISIFLLCACSTLKYSKEKSFNSYSVKLNSVDLSIGSSNFTVSPTVYGSRNEFAVISIQSFLNIEVARLLLFSDSAFLIDRLNYKIYCASIPSNSLKKFEEVVLNKNESKFLEILLSRNDKLVIKSEPQSTGAVLSVKFNTYSFRTEINDISLKNEKISKPELPKKYEKIPFILH